MVLQTNLKEGCEENSANPTRTPYSRESKKFEPTTETNTMRNGKIPLRLKHFALFSPPAFTDLMNQCTIRFPIVLDWIRLLYSVLTSPVFLVIFFSVVVCFFYE